jgi:hypothetical protein
LAIANCQLVVSGVALKNDALGKWFEKIGNRQSAIGS